MKNPLDNSRPGQFQALVSNLIPGHYTFNSNSFRGLGSSYLWNDDLTQEIGDEWKGFGVDSVGAYNRRVMGGFIARLVQLNSPLLFPEDSSRDLERKAMPLAGGSDSSTSLDLTENVTSYEVNTLEELQGNKLLKLDDQWSIKEKMYQIEVSLDKLVRAMTEIQTQVRDLQEIIGFDAIDKSMFETLRCLSHTNE